MANRESPKELSKTKKLAAEYEERLEKIRSIDASGLSSEYLEALCKCVQREIETLNSKQSSILPRVTRISISGKYTSEKTKLRESLKALQTFDNKINELLNDPKGCFIEGRMSQKFEDKLTSLTNNLELMHSNPLIIQSMKHRLNTQYDQCVQQITEKCINIVLPIEVRDSIDLIEKTLAEPELYSLPSLIMWKKTAMEKVDKIKNRQKYYVPKPVKNQIIGRYESMIKQLQAEILKLRTYPIPESWQSEAMREGLTHIIEGEFVFLVHPGLMEEMKPLEPSEVDPLPGGLTRQDYDKRLMRLYEECVRINGLQKARGEWGRDLFTKDLVTFTFREFPLLYRDRRTLEYLVDKNGDDELLKEIFRNILREIRHYKNNRIDIPSYAIDSNDCPMVVAPPKEERNIPVTSGIDRGASFITQESDFPSGIIVERNSVITTDKCNHRVSWYRATDLSPIGSEMNISLDTPLSLTIFRKLLYVCYCNQISQFSMTWKDNEISGINRENTIEISQCCCVASNEWHLFVGTLKPSIILMNTDTGRPKEYTLDPIRYHTADKKNRYPWLQDMKTTRNHVFCLFTGSPYPLQMFSLTGEFVATIIAEDQLAGAYNFNVHLHPLTAELSFYICDFWGNDVKVFNHSGKYIETIREKGNQLGQVIRPTAIFIERSGYITVSDLKEDNCLQRL